MDNLPYTTTEQKLLFYAPLVTGSLSILGCIFMFWKILNSPRRRKRLHSRLLLGMSVYSFLQALGVYIDSLGNSYQLIQDERSHRCLFVGVLWMIGFAVPMYNAGIALQYVLIVKYNYSKGKMKNVEIILHGLPGVWVALCVIAVPTRNMFRRNDFGTCTLAFNENQFLPVTCLVSAVLSIIIGSIAMVTLYNTVHKNELKNEKYMVGEASKAQSKLVKKQVILFLFSYYIIWSWPVISYFYSTLTGKEPFVLALLRKTFFAFQGAMNMIVYMRPKIHLCSKKRNNDETEDTGSIASTHAEEFMPKRVAKRKSSINFSLFGSFGSKKANKSENEIPVEPPRSSYVPRDSTVKSFCQAVQIKNECGELADSTAFNKSEHSTGSSSFVAENLQAQDDERSYFDDMKDDYLIGYNEGNGENTVYIDSGYSSKQIEVEQFRMEAGIVKISIDSGDMNIHKNGEQKDKDDGNFYLDGMEDYHSLDSREGNGGNILYIDSGDTNQKIDGKQFCMESEIAHISIDSDDVCFHENGEKEDKDDRKSSLHDLLGIKGKNRGNLSHTDSELAHISIDSDDMNIHQNKEQIINIIVSADNDD